MTTAKQLHGLAEAMEVLADFRRKYDIRPGHNYERPVVSVGDVDYILTWVDDYRYEAEVDSNG